MFPFVLPKRQFDLEVAPLLFKRSLHSRVIQTMGDSYRDLAAGGKYVGVQCMTVDGNLTANWSGHHPSSKLIKRLSWIHVSFKLRTSPVVAFGACEYGIPSTP